MDRCHDAECSILCDRCSVISFNDGDLFGSHADESGPTRWQLPFDLTDEGPEFPQLRQSAYSGCNFCALLLQEVIAEFQDVEAHRYRVKLNLYYHWEQHNPSRLAFLVVEAPWWTGKDVTEPSVSLQYVRLVFEVETDHREFCVGTFTWLRNIINDETLTTL